MAISNNKIGLDDKEQLKAFYSSDSYKAVIKLLNVLAESQINAVLQVDLSIKSDRDLAYAKVRSEGATKIARDFHDFVTSLTRRPKSDQE